MYSLGSFGQMMLDSTRMSAYVGALKDAVSSDSVVLDIGCGTGIFGLLACQFGARRVICVDPNNAINVARTLAQDNGFGDRMEFHQIMSTELQLDEPADVMISDLRGVVPLFLRHIPSVIDARNRLLAPDGILIPLRDNLFITIVEDERNYRSIESPWTDAPHGLNLSSASNWLKNQWFKVRPDSSQLLAEPVHIGSLDYTQIDSPDFAGMASLTASRQGLVHGLCLWFDAEISAGYGFSNDPRLPNQDRPIYGNAFFPLESPLRVRAGDVVEVDIRADLIGDDYVWRWSTAHSSAYSSSTPKVQLRQSSFAGEPLSLDQLKRRAASHVPQLNAAGRLDLDVLTHMRTGQDLGTIAADLLERHPGRFSTKSHALAYVGDLAQRYSR